MGEIYTPQEALELCTSSELVQEFQKRELDFVFIVQERFNNLQKPKVNVMTAKNIDKITAIGLIQEALKMLKKS